MSLSIIVSSRGKSSNVNFTERITPPIQLDPHKKYLVQVTKIYCYYSWLNLSIQQQNNTFEYSPDLGVSWFSVVFEDGTWTPSDMLAKIVDSLVINGYPANSIRFDPNLATGKLEIELEPNFYVRWTSPLSCHAVLGFDPTIPLIGSTVGQYKANIVNGSESLILHTNLIDRKYSYIAGNQSGAIYSIEPPSVAPGTLYSAVTPDTAAWFPLSENHINEIDFKLTDQSLNPIILPEPITIVLRIKEDV